MGESGMRTSRSVTVVHPDVTIRITLRNILESHGCTVTTDHCLRDLASSSAELRPDVILLDRSLLANEGVDILTELNRKWGEAITVFLPDGLTCESAKAGHRPQLLAIVDRMLELNPTSDILMA